MQVQARPAPVAKQAEAAALPTSPSKEVGTKRLPKIYVYDLPAEVTFNGEEMVFRDNTTCEAMATGSEEDDTCVFGPHFNVSLAASPAPLAVRDVDQYQLGEILLFSLQRHPRRTHDPSEADLFFIPVIQKQGRFPWNQQGCYSAEALVQHLPHLRAENAKRHIWINPRAAWSHFTCPAFDSQPSDPHPDNQLLAATTKVALEDAVAAPREAFLDDWEVKYNVREPPKASNLHSIPHCSFTSGLEAAQLEAFRAASAVPRTRQNLVAAMWGMHGPSRAMDQRTELQLQCNKSSDCIFLSLEGLRYETNSEVVVFGSLDATFCLQPEGDTPSRKGMVDSILTGCIPVLFSPLQTKLWPWHIERWEDIAIAMDGVPSDIMGRLSQVSTDEIERLRTNMLAVLPRLSYSLPGKPRPEDALETTLAAILKLAQ